MTPKQAAWVREHAWTATMRKEYREVPGFYSMCACQGGISTWCTVGECDRCRRGEPLVSWDTMIVSRKGYHPAYFPEPYRHKTPTATGGNFVREALVWLGERRCRWLCPHACHTAAAPKQLDLFAQVGR